MTSSSTTRDEMVVKLPDDEAVAAEMRRVIHAAMPSIDAGDKEDLLSYAREIVRLRALEAVGSDDGWQPIETAPKGDAPKDGNGPPILIWREGWPTGYEGFWYASDQAWYFANLDSEYGEPEHPTHWRPLPAPPEQGQ